VFAFALEILLESHSCERGQRRTKNFEKEKSRRLKSLRASKIAFRQQCKIQIQIGLSKLSTFVDWHFFAFSKNIHLT